jgi:hypothetical protein
MRGLAAIVNAEIAGGFWYDRTTNQFPGHAS